MKYWKVMLFVIYGIYFYWKLLLLFMSLLGFRFILSGFLGFLIYVYIKYFVYGIYVFFYLKFMV